MEQEKDYPQAFEYYTKALDIFAHMIKCKLTCLQDRVQTSSSLCVWLWSCWKIGLYAKY